MKNFWKIIKIVLLVLAGLFLLALIGGFIFLKNFDIKKYKPQIIEAAQKSIGRPVNFADIDLQVSLKDGIRLNLKDFTIADNPQFSAGMFVEVGTISVGVDILSFLNARQISVPAIFVKSPTINVIRNAAGKLNVETIGAASPSAAAATSEPSSPPVTAALPAIFINSLRIENARLNYTDQSVTPAMQASVSQLNVGVDHFSLISPFSFFVEAAILSSQQNFKLDGNAQLNLRSNEVRLNNVRITTDIGLLALEEIRRLPVAASVPMPQVLEGQFTSTIKECVVSDKGLGSLALDARFSNGKILIPQVAPGITLDLRAIDLSVSDFSLERPFNINVQAAYLSDIPNIDFKGTVALDMKTQGVRLKNAAFSTDLGLWPLDQLKANVAPLKDVPLPDKIGGQFQVAIKDLAAGPKGLESILLDVLWKGGDLDLGKAVPGVSVRLSNTDLAVKDFSLGAPFLFSMQTAYLSETRNISVDGYISLNDKTQALNLKDFKIAVDLDALMLDEIKSSVTALKDAPLPQTLGGKMVVIVKKLDAGPKGLGSVLADVDLMDGKVMMKDAAPGISIDASAINLAVRNFSLTDPFEVKAKLAYLSDVPNISLGGTVSYNMNTQEARLKETLLAVDLSKLNLEQLKSSVTSLKDVALPESLSGDFSVRVADLTAGPKGLGKISADVDWKEGAVSLKNIAPGISVAASKIGLSVKNFSLGDPFDFRLQAAYLGDQPNIDLTGNVAYNPADQSVQIKGLNFKTDLSTFSMDQLRASVASLKDVPLPQSLNGDFNLTVSEATAGPKGLVSLKSQGVLSRGAVRMKELAVPVDDVELKFQADQTNATIDGLSMAIGKGTVKAQAAINDYLVKKDFTGHVEVKDINLAEVLAQEKAPVKVEGLVYADFKAQGQAADLNSITGDGKMEVKEAKLKDLNVLKLVLDKIAIIPNLSEKVKGSLSEKYIKKLEDKDTSINKIAASVVIAGGNINVDPIDVAADEFMFQGQCQADFAQNYALTGAFMIPQELAASMIKGASELQYLQDIDGNISFPLRVSGKGSGTPSFTPDVGNLMKNAVMNKGKEELGRALHKVLGGSDQPSESPDAASGGTQQGTQKSPEEEIINGIFGTIFK